MGTGILSQEAKWPGSKVDRPYPSSAMADEWASTQLPLNAFIAWTVTNLHFVQSIMKDDRPVLYFTSSTFFSFFVLDTLQHVIN